MSLKDKEYNWPKKGDYYIYPEEHQIAVKTGQVLHDLAIQVERIADALQKQPDEFGGSTTIPVSHLRDMWNKLDRDEFLDHIVFLMGKKGTTKLESSPIEKVKVIEHQKFRDGGTIEYRDIHNRPYVVPASVYTVSGIYSDTAPHTWTKDAYKNIELEVVTSFVSVGVEGEPSLFKTPSAMKAEVDPAHPDFKGDLGAVQKSAQEWVLWEFWNPANCSDSPTTSTMYPYRLATRNRSGSMFIKAWLPKDVNILQLWPNAYGYVAKDFSSQPIFDKDFPKPLWYHP